MKRLLFITHRVPYPPDKGERVRAFHEIRALSEHFEVVVAALSHGPADIESAAALEQWCGGVLVGPAGGAAGLIRGGISLLAGRSVTQGYFQSRRLGKLIADESARRPFDVVVGYCSSMLPYVLAVPAKGRVMDLVDVDSAKWASYADETRWPKSWLFRREAKTVARLERKALECCDAALLVSDAEADAMGSGDKRALAISNGVDAEFFSPDAVEQADLGPAGLVFTGSMDYRPNVEGVCWFAREVWPELKTNLPELTLTVVGRNPTAALQRLAEIPGIAVTGSVPDVRPYLAGAAVAICPLHIARGIQNKVLEAMAMGKAVVASPQAIEGIDLRVGVEAIRADSPAQWQHAVTTLLADRNARDSLGAAARACVQNTYGWPARMAPLVSLCRRLCEPKDDQEAGRSEAPAAGSSGPDETAAGRS